MEAEVFISDALRRNRELLTRGEAAVAGLDGTGLNAPLQGGWSAAQILDHMVVSNRLYESAFQAARLRAGPARMDAPRTWFGRKLQQLAGPERDSPVPRAFLPAAGPFGEDVLESWRKSQSGLLEFIEEFGRCDLGFKFRNPAVPLFRMSVADAIAVFTDHTERHVRQLEERVPRLGQGR